ncbi:WD40-repeat-containing domain protein [Phakopsora pachyrhizi]|uniref:WD40-repeat-containing domain protein n=1 Tax=Phakopsora pachyrhizi TaxID=170000 RepID=A0AAV0B716_PHAPC|nr:WD40-repeat-containing domain protein [Phakopsora pachyrhizi]CAH7681350.1 WD40-repeat-containing domain protein [Phakopsora pachyrhizi]
MVVSSQNKKKNRVKVIDSNSLSERSKKRANLRVLGEDGSDKQIKKTDEELKLEESVFGFVKDFKGKKRLGSDIDDGDDDSEYEDDERDQTDEELAQVPDEQLFSIDGPIQSTESFNDNSLSPLPKTSNLKPTTTVAQSKKRKPAWVDDTINRVSVSLTGCIQNRKKKLKTLEDLDHQNFTEDGQIRINGEEYQKRLRRQFEKMHPTPTWLKNFRKLKESSSDPENQTEERDAEEEENDYEDGKMSIDQILRSTGDLNRNRHKEKRIGTDSLPQGILQVERLRDANQAEPSSSTNKTSISSLKFHPLAPILLTASSTSKRLSFFKIDGVHNPALHFVSTPDLPIQRAEFFTPINNQSSNVLIAGNRPYFYTFDMRKCQCTKSPQGLFNRSPSSQSIKGISLSNFKFSPSGSIVAFVGLKGLIELVDFSNNISTSQVICSLRSNSPIKSLAWDRNGTELMTIDNKAEVSVWDLRMRRIRYSWLDDGGFHPTKITTTDQDCLNQSSGGDRDYCAVGSQTGIVNIYSNNRSDEFFSEESDLFGRERKPMKVIDNLTTSISNLKFNPDGQILAISSETKKDSLKVVHLKSGTVFSNWPTDKTPLGNVTDLSFDSTGKNLAIGNRKGKVLLYSLKYWS